MAHAQRSIGNPLKQLLKKALHGLGINVSRHRDWTGGQRVRFVRTNAPDGPGIEVSRYRDWTGVQRLRFMQTKEVTVVLDVGANTGQYATALRRSGYLGRIVSFEPLEGPFQKLLQSCRRDPLWQCRQIAVGERDATVPVNVSGNVVSSSLLPMLPRHSEAAPDSGYVGHQMASMTTLDSLFEELIGPSDRVALKLDVQGYESRVLEGAARTLGRTHLVEAELSLEPLYEGQGTMCEVVERVRASGFELVSLDRGFVDPRNGFTLQVDGIFLRSDA